MQRKDRMDLTPYAEVFRISPSTATEAGSWEHHYFASPCVVYPFRDDTLTGAHNAVFLGSLSIAYSPVQPLSKDGSLVNYRGFPCGPGGKCLIPYAGTWYFRIKSEEATQRAVPFIVIPFPNAELAAAHIANRLVCRPPDVDRIGVGAGATELIFSVQELLDGVTAVEIFTPTFNNGFGFRWRSAAGQRTDNAANWIFRYDGPYLPLADLYFSNTTAAATTVSRVLFY